MQAFTAIGIGQTPAPLVIMGEPVNPPSQPPVIMSRAAKTVRDIFLSGRPLTYIRSAEEQRVALILREVAASGSDSIPIWTWSLTEGLRSETAVAGAETPRGVL